eukprot:gene16941-8431_t
MALWHIPLFREEDDHKSFLDDIFDWTFPPASRITRYNPYFKQRRAKRRYSSKQKDDLKSENNEDRFSITMDGDKLKVTGKHHQQTDHGYESSEFERCFPIPADVDAKSFTSKLNDDGILEITAAKIKPLANQGQQEDETNFKLTFDVSDYKPEEISVKLQGNELVVNGEQNSESKDGEDSFFHHRKFSRRILLPKNVKLETLQSKLTKYGKLMIEAEKMAAIEPTVRQLEVEYEVDLKSKEDVKKETNEADNATMEE